MVAALALPIAQLARFAELERIISKGIKTYLEVADALAEIHEKKLYRDKYDTFEEYCQARWKLGRAYVYRLIQFAKMSQELSPVGDIAPQNERQIRALAGLDPIERQQAWERAVEDAGGRQPTAEEVERAVELVRLTRKALATLPAEQQVEVLRNEEVRILARAAVIELPLYVKKASKTLEKFQGIVESMGEERAARIMPLVEAVRAELERMG